MHTQVISPPCPDSEYSVESASSSDLADLSWVNPLFVETPSSTSPPGVPFLTTGQQPSVNEELNTELHNLQEYDVSSSVSAVHAFTGVGGF
jgi:hypothetical protein